MADDLRKLDQRAVDAIVAEHKRYLAGSGGGRRADFRGAEIVGVSFRKADLSRAMFHGAKLRGCDLAGVDLSEADFTGADLARQDLSGALNLPVHRLGAARLEYAKLPGDPLLAEGLASLREMAGRAERTLYLLAASCVTVVLITLSHEHVDMFRNAGAVDLPGLGIPVPARLFYQLSPWLLLVLYVYLLSGLSRFWTHLRDQPAVLPHNRYVHREVQCFPNFAVVTCALWPHLASARRETRWERLLLGFAAWWMVPLSLTWVWYWDLARHDAVGAVVQVLAIGTAVGVAVVGFGMMHRVLHRGLSWAPAASGETEAPSPRRAERRLAIAPSDILIHRRPLPPEADEHAPSLRRTAAIAVTATTCLLAAGVAGAAVFLPGCASLPSRYGPTPGICHVAAANLSHADLDSLTLHGVNLRRAFLYHASGKDVDLEEAELRGAFLSKANLTRAIMKDAHLQRAVLWEANLSGAELKEAEFQGADLRGANLRGARLQGAVLAGADLRGADLTGAILCGAELIGDGVSARLSPGVLKTAHGVERLRTGRAMQPVDRPWSPDATLRGPEYLTPAEAVEYVRWRDAAGTTDTLLAYLREHAGAGRLPRAAVREKIEAIDLSMGSATQRVQQRTLAALGGRGFRLRPSADVAYSSLRPDLKELVRKVYEKAENHCVDLPARELREVP